MAIVDDVRKDKRTKLVLAQTNTKTVSVPPTSTGLTGDQLPDEVFTVDDFDLIKNQVNLEDRNFQLIDALNKIGQITNMQSQSGPIPGTAKIVTASAASSGIIATVFQPPAGQVWKLIDITVVWTNNSGSITASPVLEDANGEDIFIGRVSSTRSHHEFPEIPQDSIFITNEVFLRGWSQGSFDSGVWKAAVIRVR